jgi:hypothetical protein
VAGALVRSSDEFGLGVNAVSEKREDVTTIRQAVGERHFEGLNKDQKAATTPFEINLSGAQMLAGLVSALSIVAVVLWALIKLWLFEQ